MAYVKMMNSHPVNSKKQSANIIFPFMIYSGCDLDLFNFGYRIRDCDSLLN